MGASEIPKRPLSVLVLQETGEMGAVISATLLADTYLLLLTGGFSSSELGEGG